jgi:nitrate reductase beta subunit
MDVYKKLMAVRVYKRAQSVGDIPKSEVEKVIREAGTGPEEIEEIYNLTSKPSFQDRFVIPPFMREQAIENTLDDTFVRKTEAGFGFVKKPVRGW